MRVGGEFRVSPIDDGTPEFSISYDGEDNFTLANETGTDILFAVGVDNNEVMRIDGDEESLLLSESEKEDLINALQEDVNDIQREKDKIDVIKEKSQNIIGN